MSLLSSCSSILSTFTWVRDGGFSCDTAYVTGAYVTTYVTGCVTMYVTANVTVYVNTYVTAYVTVYVTGYVTGYVTAYVTAYVTVYIYICSDNVCDCVTHLQSETHGHDLIIIYLLGPILSQDYLQLYFSDNFNVDCQLLFNHDQPGVGL